MRSRVIALGSTTSRNRIGRVYSLWLTARAAGLDFTHVTVDDGPLWAPLAGQDDFLATVRTVPDLGEMERVVRASAGPDTALVVCKPRPELVRLGRTLADTFPVVVDIDDPELLDPWHGAGPVLRAKRVLREGPTPFRFGWAERAVREMAVITSNPLLQQRYGGELVPHVRNLDPAGPRVRGSGARPFVVAFVGTLREHKGGDALRTAVAAVARDDGIRLCVTAAAPPDAHPWEDWVGPTTLAEGATLVARADAVAILSRPGVWGDLQLPAKLIDAMAAGVPAVVTARAPMLWAAGGTALVVRDDARGDLADAFTLLADDAGLADRLGAAARRRAAECFTPEAVAPAFLRAIRRA